MGKIRITIETEAGDGKTTLALWLADKLAEYGFQCNVADADVAEGIPRPFGPTLEQRLNHMGERHEVNIQTIQRPYNDSWTSGVCRCGEYQTCPVCIGAS